ncbi:P-loop containing nucleoside triphosphate hydrolase protein [Daldinia sp. FL1419]|nr:P-loop containing nucleoside triphosphate hydrolase protein [Daldinia sp. FL1419]
MTEEKGGETNKSTKEKVARGKVFTYIRLLLFSNPTWLDLGLILCGVIFAIAAGTPYPLIAILFGELVNNLNGLTCDVRSNVDTTQYRGTIDGILVKLVALAAAQFVLVYLHTVCWNVQSQRLMHRLRDRYLQHVLRQEVSFFDDKHAGEISARIDDEFTAIQTGTSEKVGRFIGQSSFFVTAFVVAFIKQPTLAAILFSLTPAFVALTFAGSYFFKKFATKSAASFAAGGSIASEALSRISIVRAFDAGPRLEAKFSKHMALAHKFAKKKSVVAGIQAGLLYFIAYSSNALAYWQGSRMIADAISGKGDATFGQVYTVVFLLVDACIILGGLAPLFPIFGAASSAYERIEGDLNRHSPIDADSGEKLPSDAPGCIEMRGISFAYPSRPDTLALKNVDLTFAAGKHTAIVGQSGSGKSTIAALINRLYEPTAGTIVFDGMDIQLLSLKNLRGHVSLVQQESELFSRSIFENIALGLANSSRPEHQDFRSVIVEAELEDFISTCSGDILKAAANKGGAIAQIAALVQKAANLADLTFIDALDQGFGTKIGTGLVSGGQAQRIALARSLIRDPKVLVLDEATASLDSTTEKRIQESIDKLATGRTIISIAHRLSTISHVDHVIVMQGAEVVEQGSYQELQERGGAFSNLLALQGLESVVEKASGSSSLNNTDTESLDGATAKDLQPGKIGRAENAAQATPEKIAPIGADKSVSSNEVLSGMSWLIRPDLAWFVVAVPCAMIVGCTFSAMALIFGHTVSALSACDATASRIIYLGYFFSGLVFMLAVVEFLANVGSWSLFGRISENLVYRIRILSFRTLLNQSVQWHNSENRTPTYLLTIITKDGASIAAFSGSIIATALSILINFFVAIIISHAFAWKIALVCLAMVPILFGAGILQIKATSRHQERSHKAFVKAIGITVEAVNQIKTVTSFSLGDEIINRYRRALKKPKASMIGEALHACLYLSIANSTGLFVYSLSYWWGSQLIMRGEYTQTQFYIVQVSMLVSATLWGQMFSLAPEFSRAKSAASRTLGVINLGNDRRLATPSEILGSTDRDTAGGNSRDIEAEADSKPQTVNMGMGAVRGLKVAFKNVSFTYPSRPDQPSLKGVSFTVQPGQFFGIVGPSGAGKSTIMSLIQGMYSPSLGSVEIGGVDISLCENSSFRENTAVVPQDSALFNGSIKFNVGLGARPSHDASDVEIEDACRIANIHDTIVELPQGYDTECGPNGSRLSGGQRQRVAVARALVRSPGLLLLDEPSSALDAESERAVRLGIENFASQGSTVIAITHRLHTVQKADVILVVEGGKIVDKGTHSDLMERSESYRLNALRQI